MTDADLIHAEMEARASVGAELYWRKRAEAAEAALAEARNWYVSMKATASREERRAEAAEQRASALAARVHELELSCVEYNTRSRAWQMQAEKVAGEKAALAARLAELQERYGIIPPVPPEKWGAAELARIVASGATLTEEGYNKFAAGYLATEARLAEVEAAIKRALDATGNYGDSRIILHAALAQLEGKRPTAKENTDAT